MQAISQISLCQSNKQGTLMSDENNVGLLTVPDIQDYFAPSWARIVRSRERLTDFRTHIPSK